ncbi:MAG: flavin reductase family protein, partial [Candidatus Aerophobetes bacterium]|nr:flavin reductase family protein [Candidatus Aerophobetes bacterium]
IIWNKPIFVVLVRPSRFTYNLIKNTGVFTVNVPSEGMIEAVSFCGTVSGRDYNKFKEKGLTPLPGKRVESPLIKECLLHYECKVVHKNVVIPGELTPNISSLFYPENDYHDILFGEIMATYASDKAGDSLRNF